MARQRQTEVERLLARLIRDPKTRGPVLALLAIVAVVALLIQTFPRQAAFPAGPSPFGGGQPADVFFAFWNVENLFDDRDDRRSSQDEPYDNWFARDAAARDLKYDRLAEAILKINGGRGPDILATCEVESARAAELLRDRLNRQIPEASWQYHYVFMEELSAGRHIAPAVISRVPPGQVRFELIGSKQRTLRGSLSLNGHELILIPSHWTSRLTDQTGDRRERYAATIYDEVARLHGRDAKADILICGDFNDGPDEPSVVNGLNATGDADRVKRAGAELLLFNVLAGKNRNQFGTMYFSGWHIYDQIVVSPGMLDGDGWSCDPDTVGVMNSLVRPGDTRTRRPWRFGGERDDSFERGYSDHFPVTLRLRVAVG